MSLLDLLRLPNENAGRIFGVVPGVVTSNDDPEKLGRVKLRFPWLSDEIESAWARVALPAAGNQRGAYFLPDVDDEVLVAFEQGDVRFPYIIGGLWSSPAPPPEENSGAENNVRSIVSRSGLTLRFDDTDGAERIEIRDKDKKQQIVIDIAEQSITIAAEGDITITSSNGMLTLRANGIALESQAEVSIHAQGDLSLEGSGKIELKGASEVQVTSQGNLSLAGSGKTALKGAIVEIN